MLQGLIVKSQTDSDKLKLKCNLKEEYERDKMSERKEKGHGILMKKVHFTLLKHLS